MLSSTISAIIRRSPTLHRHKPILFPESALPRDRGFGSRDTSLNSWLTRLLFCLSNFLYALAARGENLISQVTFGLQVSQRNGLKFPPADLSGFILQGVEVLKLREMCPQCFTNIERTGPSRSLGQSIQPSLLLSIDVQINQCTVHTHIDTAPPLENLDVHPRNLRHAPDYPDGQTVQASRLYTQSVIGAL